MKKITSIIIILLAIVSGTAVAGPIDFILDRLGVVREDRLENQINSVKNDISETKNKVVDLEQYSTKNIDELKLESIGHSLLWWLTVVPLWGIVIMFIIWKTVNKIKDFILSYKLKSLQSKKD